MGASLLEILVALTVIGIASTGLFYSASMTSSGNTRSRDRAAAMSLAIDKIEELKNTSFADLTAGSGTDTRSATGVAGGPYARAWTITDGTISGVPIKDVTVAVSWPGNGPVSLATTVSNLPQLGLGFPTAYVRNWNQAQ
jgi:type IV pilus assembly protein PilV